MCDGKVSLKTSQCNLLFSFSSTTSMDSGNSEGLAVCILGVLATADGLAKTCL